LSLLEKCGIGEEQKEAKDDNLFKLDGILGESNLDDEIKKHMMTSELNNQENREKNPIILDG